jgi:DmsE family decaheme c-type cytochrome
LLYKNLTRLLYFETRRYELPEKSRVKKKWPLARCLGLLGLAVIVIGFLGFLPSEAIAEDGKEGAPKMEACAECHEDMAAAFKGSRHGKGADCTCCHGDAAKHLENAEAGTIFAFKATDTALKKSKQCLACHQNAAGQYFASAHAKAAMDCTKCHSIHKKGHSMAALKTKMCAGCHEEVVAQFRLNERHRLQEGILECTTCHDVHGPAIRQRLAGFKHEACFKCHRDKAGPFIYEHQASRVEGCTACHEVHGSPNRHMLAHQNSADLCISCHTLTPSWHSRFASGDANCVSCHSTIHGSNLSNIFLK